MVLQVTEDLYVANMFGQNKYGYDGKYIQIQMPYSSVLKRLER
jgi:hypothetical protein